jgi:hypothetical protein
VLYIDLSVSLLFLFDSFKSGKAKIWGKIKTMPTPTGESEKKKKASRYHRRHQTGNS